MNRNIFSLVFNRARNMLVVAPEIATGAHKASRGKRVRLQSGCGRGASGTAFVFAAAPWLLTASLAVACMPVAHAQTVTNPGFETGNLTGWTPGPDTGTQSSSSYSSTGVGVSVVTGMTSFDSTSGQSPGTYSWTVDPYGTYMASLQATGTLSGSNGFSNAMTAMGLDSTSSTAISTALGGTVTNAAWITQSLNLTAGQSFTMAWEYISTDYQPYNDGSITSLVNTSSPTTLATVNNQNAQYALLGATNTGTGDYSTGSYGSTGWETATYTVSQAGTYLLGFASFNLTDEVNSPILFVDQQPGLTYNNGVLFNPIAANAGTGAPSPTPTNIVIDTAQPYYGTSTLGSATSATFDGGTLKVDQTNPTVTQDFGIDSTNGIIDQAGQASVFTGTISDATSGTPGALTITNSGSGGSVTLSGNNTYSGGTTITGGSTVLVSSSGNLGTGGVTLDNGTLETTAGFTDTRNYVLNSGGGTLDTDGNNVTLQGGISGSGGLTVANSGSGGALTLTGTDTYTGSTAVGAGATLALTGSGSIASSSGLTDNGNFDISGASSTETLASLGGSGTVALGNNSLALSNAGDTFTGVISGDGGVLMNGGTEAFAGANTYTGGTTLNGGTLQVSSDGNLGAASGALNFNGGTLENTATFTTTRNINLSGPAIFNTDTGSVLTDTAGTISGSGPIVKEGLGTLILGADQSTGGLNVNGGTLALTGASTDTGATNIASGATLAITGNGSDASASSINDSGTLDLSGANGGQSIASLSGNGAVSLGGNGLTLTNANGNFGGSIGGTGGVTLAGGTEALSGSNTYTGGTTLNGGTLQVSSDANLGDAAGALNFNGGTLENTATFITTRNIDLTGPAVFNTDTGTVLTDTAGTISGSGPIVKEGLGTLILGADQSTGGLNVNGGTLQLTGASTDTGATNIASGATLAITGNGSDASASSINDSGTLDLSGANGGQSIASLAGNGAVNLGGNGLTLTNANGNFGGSIGGTGGVTLAGGTEALSGSNTYTGGTTLNGGTLQVSSDANLGDAGGALNFNGGTLQTTASFTSGRDINTTGPATINTNAGTVFTDTSGTISGSGSINKMGTGTLVLGADQSTGGLNVNGGTLQLTGTSTDTGATNIASGATLAITGNGSDASASSINNSGTLDISGANGGQSIASLAGNGAVNLGGNGLTLTNANGNFGGSIGGTGGVTLAGGTEVLSGSNTYTGGTTLTGGNLVVNSDANLGASGTPVTFNGGTLTVTQSINTSRDFVIQSGGAGFNAPTGVTVQDSGNISGNGGLVKSGGGTLVVSGANTFTGGTLIDGGVVQIDTGSSLGTGTIMLNGGTLQTTASLNNNQNVVVSGNAGVNVNAGTSTLMAGTIQQASGSGCFVKSGTGELDLTGSAVLSGGTCVEQGMLRANGHLVSDVSVYAPGELRGIGLINGPINVNGRLAPGNSPGTLTVTGTVTMNAGSTYEEDIDGLGTGTGKGNYSRLIITGANSQFIANGTLMPQLRGITGNASNTYVPSIGDVYQIVVAQGGIVGQFNSLTQPEGLAAGTRFVAFYNVSNNHSIELGVLPDSYASLIAGSGANRNAVAAAQALDSALNLQASGTATAGQSELLLALASAKSSQLGGVMDNLAGQVYADQAAAARASGQVIQSDTLGHLVTDDSNTGSVQPGHLAWATASHEGNRWSGDAQGSGFQTGSNQISVGVDLLADHGSVIGIGAVNHHTDVLGGVAQGAIYGTDAIVYGQQPIASVLLDGMAAIGHDTWTTRRNDPTGTSGGMFSWVGGNDRMASIVARMPIQAGGTRIEPYASVTWQHIERNAVDEAGTSSAALQVGKLSASGARAKLGVNLDSNQQDPLATEITYQVGAAVGEDSRGLLSPAVQETLQGATFSTKAPLVGRSFVELHANGTMRLTRSTYLYGGLTDEAGVRRSAYGVSAGVRVKF